MANFFDGISQQTKNMSDIARLNSLISDRKKKLSAQCFELGKQYYQAHQTDAEPEFPEAIAEVRHLLAEIKEAEESIMALKGIKKCPNCGTEIPVASVFCPGCGAQVGTPPRRCPGCGKEVKEGTNFCVFCGTKLG